MGSRMMIAAMLLLAGCEQGGHVAVTQTAGEVRFAITDEKGRPGCADLVSVAAAVPDDATPLWQVTAVDPARCTATLRYGVTTDRFAEQVRPAPLTSGVTYRVRVTGAGFAAVQDFSLTAGGGVRTR